MFPAIGKSALAEEFKRLLDEHLSLGLDENAKDELISAQYEGTRIVADFFDIGYYTETRSGKQRFVKLGYGAADEAGGAGFISTSTPITFQAKRLL
jgi:hypothetical protein